MLLCLIAVTFIEKKRFTVLDTSIGTPLHPRYLFLSFSVIRYHGKLSLFLRFILFRIRISCIMHKVSVIEGSHGGCRCVESRQRRGIEMHGVAWFEPLTVPPKRLVIRQALSQ